jgi:glutamate 5-kinase
MVKEQEKLSRLVAIVAALGAEGKKVISVGACAAGLARETFYAKKAFLCISPSPTWNCLIRFR